jgi:Response regulator containing a CheY-like receiver domain and an HD-GYP domain
MVEAEGNLARRVLVADGDLISAFALRGCLADKFLVDTANSGEATLRIARAAQAPELILLDSGLPDPGAFETLSLLKSDEATSRIPVIFVSAFLDDAGAERALGLGASDFLMKPFSPCIVQLRISSQLELSRSRAQLEALVEERTLELKESRLEVIRRLSRAAEYRDNETGMHIIRMSKYAQRIAQAAGASLSKSELVLNAAPMHDIGKIGVPDGILLKRGPLDEAEWDIMRRHCAIGASIVGGIDSELMRSASSAALSHHERFDGKGYPSGLSGESIPWIGRVVALADVFDALTSDRPYKKAWAPEPAFDLIESESGSHFDPELVEAFMGAKQDILEIKALYAD